MQLMLLEHSDNLVGLRGCCLQAVTAAEQISGAKHPRVAFVLAMLADMYARSQRITMAEGLFRCNRGLHAG